IVALGAIKAILSTSPGLSSRFSTLTISFLLSDFDDTFIATLTICPSPPPIPRIFRTSRACPAEIWSMTDQIGRASCRERVEMLGVGGAVNRKAVKLKVQRRLTRRHQGG